MSEAVASLRSLGFTEYESRAYVALLRASPLTGYELARRARIPRPNIYPVLHSLMERGAVVRLDAPEGVRYAPVPPADLLANLNRQWHSSLQQAQTILENLGASQEPRAVWSLTGRPAVLAHARQLLGKAGRSVWLGLWPPEALALSHWVAEVEARGVQVTTLCLKACSPVCGGCRGELYRCRVAPDGDPRWFALAADGTEVVVAQVGPDEEAQGIRTRQGVLVQLTEEYLRHSIALATLLEKGGRPLVRLPNTVESWLEVLRERLQQD